jgi:hypothetical protein
MEDTGISLHSLPGVPGKLPDVHQPPGVGKHDERVVDLARQIGKSPPTKEKAAKDQRKMPQGDPGRNSR